MYAKTLNLRYRRFVVLTSALLLTLTYWFLALWYDHKTAHSKNLIVARCLIPESDWIDLWQYIWQFGMALVLLAFIPFLLTRYVLKTDLKILGLGLGNRPGEALMVCAVIYPLVCVSTFFSSKDPAIGGEYPLSILVGSSWLVFFAYQVAYFFYFFSYEFFYRGFLQFGLLAQDKSSFSRWAIIVFQTLLTTLFHIGKPGTEIIAAAFAGPVFGYLAIRFGSVWYGMGIHYIMNILIDYFSLRWQHHLPGQHLLQS